MVNLTFYLVSSMRGCIKFCQMGSNLIRVFWGVEKGIGDPNITINGPPSGRHLKAI